MKINVAGVLIDNVSKAEAIVKIDSFVQSAQSYYVVTPYSEMIVFAQDDENYKKALNGADLSLADGFSLILASRFLGSEIKERITGSRFVYDIARLALDKNYSLALVGGQGNAAAGAAYELKKKFPGLRINLAVSGRPFDQQILNEINSSNSDILLIAYSVPKQELWLAQNVKNLTTKVAIGLGGTFDYLSGKYPTAPHFMHYLGLEWLWRLITQPRRIFRIWNAVPILIYKVIKYKINASESKS